MKQPSIVNILAALTLPVFMVACGQGFQAKDQTLITNQSAATSDAATNAANTSTCSPRNSQTSRYTTVSVIGVQSTAVASIATHGFSIVSTLNISGSQVPLQMTHNGTEVETQTFTYGELIIDATAQCLTANCQDYVLLLNVGSPSNDVNCTAQIKQVGAYKVFYASSTQVNMAPTETITNGPGAFVTFDVAKNTLSNMLANGSH